MSGVSAGDRATDEPYHDGPTVESAKRKASLDALDPDVPAVAAGAPRLLTRAVRRLAGSLAEKARLGIDVGSAHPDMKRIVRRIEHFRRAVTVQLEAERAFTQAWIDLLAALPACTLAMRADAHGAVGRMH